MGQHRQCQPWEQQPRGKVSRDVALGGSPALVMAFPPPPPLQVTVSLGGDSDTHLGCLGKRAWVSTVVVKNSV